MSRRPVDVSRFIVQMLDKFEADYARDWSRTLAIRTTGRDVTDKHRQRPRRQLESGPR